MSSPDYEPRSPKKRAQKKANDFPSFPLITKSYALEQTFQKMFKARDPQPSRNLSTVFVEACQYHFGWNSAFQLRLRRLFELTLSLQWPLKHVFRRKRNGKN